MLFRDIKLIDGDFCVKSGMYLRTDGAFISELSQSPLEELDGEIVYDGREKLLMPGFYNAHCHVPMTLLRGYGEGLPLDRWLNEKIFPFEALLTPEDVYWGTKLGAMELMASGTVSLSDMYFHIRSIAKALDECGMKANICAGISSPDPGFDVNDSAGFRDTLSLHDDIRAGAFGGRIIADMGLHAEYTSAEGLVRQVAEAASSGGYRVQVHVSETLKEHEECHIRHGGRTPVSYLSDCGLFDSPLTAAHCVYIEDEDIEIMKEKGAFMAHNPSSNLKLASGIAPLRDLLSSGLSVALGTDGASSNNNLNMLEEMHMAAMIARGVTGDSDAVSAENIVKMATLSGALSQGRNDCGRIMPGMRADLIVIDLDKPHMQPDFDTLANLVFSAQASDVVLTMIDGRIVYRDGEFTFADREEVIYEANKCMKRILSEL